MPKNIWTICIKCNKKDFPYISLYCLNIKSKICGSFHVDVNRVETEALLKKKTGRAYYKACYSDFNIVALRGCFSLPKSVLCCRRLFVKTFIPKSYRIFYFAHSFSIKILTQKKFMFRKFRRERSSWDKFNTFYGCSL